MEKNKTFARFDKDVLAGLAEHKLVPSESYSNTLARLLGLRKVPPPMFKIPKEVNKYGRKTKA